ncbi:MAG: hypothetical protein MJ072_06070, partial [Clostridia bacterium]|nr:hypothetical protein [Clostridia bacterium]
MTNNFKKVLTGIMSLILCFGMGMSVISGFGITRTDAQADEHVHGRCEKHEEQTATCTEDGYKEYYECSCGEFFEDSECTLPISNVEDWKKGSGKLPAGHIFGEWH